MLADPQETLVDRQIPHTNNNENFSSVICIESDQEEDERIREENRPTRLGVDRRLGRARDAMNRFLNSNGTNIALQQISYDAHGAGATVGNSCDDDDDDDDDLAIVGEVNRPMNHDTPIDSSAEFVDLDEEVEEQQRHPTAILVHRPLNEEYHETEGDDDALEIIQERTAGPRVRLNLPGGETIEISASPTDRPIRRSFEWQQNLRQSRRQMLRRSARRARQLLFEPEDSDSQEESDSVRLPPNILLFRRQEQLRQRQAQRRRYEQATENANTESSDSGLAEIRRRINSHPPDVRSAFEHAQSLHEFRSILQNVAPITLQECDADLIALFTEYRSRVVERWAEDRVRTNREEARANRDSFNRLTTRNNGRFLRSHVGTESSVAGGSLGSYIMMNVNRPPNHFGNWDHDYDDNDEEARTQSIMNMIQEREEMEHDMRTKKFMEKTKSQQDQFMKKSMALPDGYSASFDTEPKIKMEIVKDGKPQTVIVEDFELASKCEDVPVCCLCGVELGIGIPEDFHGISKVDRGVSFECLVYRYGFHCPYQSLSKPSQLDRDLSKRTFVASCGHTFCGRCFARIDNARSKSRMAKKKLAELRGSSHPDNYGPKTCPAPNCRACLRSRGKMREAFF
ncbi:hypothetical protein HG535_0C02510 [Zygotorulaspora mrakii]|uniref:Uncharacterized protein n=1 Tax=Zygotorulaspora mrakii TaxID=42260 RepID=A0A7H9B1Q1_ZYGMR|nr:uncharacterized protein HG535_0C02510 [Zygotorulaspora mrakii]QLG71899.1 hypothetical protein HG535_0C02510 [Zygotorulaspora mrakii]